MAKLYFKYGSMNCGKTTLLLQTAHNYEERGMKVFLAKPLIDTKGEHTVTSRLGIARKVDYLISPQDELLTQLVESVLHSDRQTKTIDCLLVDEVQFLKNSQIEVLYQLANEHDIPVICFGLRTDFLNKGFEGSSRLLELAQSIQEIKNVCSCGKKATCNIRLVNGRPVFHGEQVSIDGSVDSVSYEAVCAKCFLALSKRN